MLWVMSGVFRRDQAPLHTDYIILRMDARALSVPWERFTTWALSPAPYKPHLFLLAKGTTLRQWSLIVFQWLLYQSLPLTCIWSSYTDCQPLPLQFTACPLMTYTLLNNCFFPFFLNFQDRASLCSQTCSVDEAGLEHRDLPVWLQTLKWLPQKVQIHVLNLDLIPI